MSRPTIRINGTAVKVQDTDYDGDGITGETESISHHKDEVQLITQKSELGEVTEQMNKDEIETQVGMTSIDKMSRLSAFQIPALTTWDYLINDHFLPRGELHLTRQTKRLWISEDGKGRAEYVDVVGRKQDMEARKTGIGDKIKTFAGGNNNTQ